MTKEERSALLRQRLAALGGWRQWKPTGRPVRRKEERQPCKRHPHAFGLLHTGLGKWQSEWVRTPDPVPRVVIATKQPRDDENPLVKVGAIFDAAREACLDLREVSARLEASPPRVCAGGKAVLSRQQHHREFP